MLQNAGSLDLITRYLNDPSNQELHAELTEFRMASAENEAFFIEIEHIWKRAALASRLEDVDSNLAAKKLEQHLTKNIKPKVTAFTWFKGVAASILLIAIGYLVYQQSTKPSFITKMTAKNQIDSVKLADGSVVILAENTELRYPKQFKNSVRQIYLTKGQAFFKVSKDKEHPFKVTMNHSDVVVLGTSFNLKLTLNTIELAVKTGRVQFSPHEDGATSIVTAGQALMYDASKKELIAVTAANSDSWLTKELVFVDTPLDEVCKKLTEYYGVSITMKNKNHEAKKLNAKFTDQSLNNVLLVLNETYNIKIHKEQNQIFLLTP